MHFTWTSRAARVLAAAGLLAATLVPFLTTTASGQESLQDLRDRMDQIQAELDAATSRIESLRTDEDELGRRLVDIKSRMADLTKEQAALEKRVVEAARNLYTSGGSDTLEVLMSAESFAELTRRAELLARVSERDTAAFVRYSRTEDELNALQAELTADREELATTRAALADASEELQARFEEVSEEYKDLRARLAAAQQESAPVQVAAAPALSASLPRPSGPMTCPVAGAVSFVDTWGAPRSGGRMHEGVDMMAAYGTPIVAIVDGAITYAGYGGSAGNWQVLSGDDGNAYWYMHNQANLVTGGHVSVGEQIATVGDTGNAAGTPHLHFEYHPGGGGPINPTPLVASIC